MESQLLLQAEQMNEMRMRGKRWQLVVAILASLVIFITVYALVLPALTLERELVCDCEEHVHSEACYSTESVLVCELEENHVHTDACYGEAEVCVCGLEECEGHTHSDACYTEETYLACGCEECEGHVHSAECYTSYEVLVCEENHEHTAECYETVTELSCDRIECEGHTHSDACYVTESVLSCGLEECEGHTHGAECYATETVLLCGLEEGHVHTEACYAEIEVLDCGLEEHTHSEECYAISADAAADTESVADWNAMFADLEFSGDWSEDLLAVAYSQLGYTESTRNFITDENGNNKGYTRYGAWYGVPYGDWCAMFVSFCLNYAGIPAEAVPYNSCCEPWTEILDERDMFVFSGDYEPQAGDIIFFDTQLTGSASHVGLVYDCTDGVVTTIEGNTSDTVAFRTYSLNDAHIYGYGLLPENAENIAETAEATESTEITQSRGGEGWTVTVTYDAATAFDGEAELRVTPLEAGTEEFEALCEEAGMDFTWQFDISFFVNDEEVEPMTPVEVAIDLAEEDSVFTTHYSVTHFAADGIETMEIAQSDTEDGQSVEFTADSFSTYSISKEQSTEIEVGDTVIMNGTGKVNSRTVYNHSWAITSDSDVVTLSGSTSSTATATGVKEGTAKVTHTYYTNREWHNGSHGSQGYYTYSGETTETFTITVKAATYTVTFTDESGSNTAVVVSGIAKNGSLTASQLPTGWTRTGYTLTGWKMGTITYAPDRLPEQTITADTVITAVWTADCVVRFSLNGEENRAEAPASVSVPYGGTLSSLPTPAWTDASTQPKVFAGWYSDPQCTNPFTDETVVDTDLTLYAKWEEPGTGYYVYFYDFDRSEALERQVLRTYTAAEGGTVSAFSPTMAEIYPEGANSVWDGTWYLNEARTVTYDFSQPVSDMTDYLTGDGETKTDLYLWPGELDQVSLIFVSGGSRIAPLSVKPSTVVDLSAYTPTRDGYAFAGWYLDEALTQPVSDEYKVTAATILYGKWETGYTKFTAVLSTENADDIDFTTSQTLGDWYALAGSTIVVQSSGTTHKVMCTLDGETYSPVYTNENLTEQASLSDVYKDYFLFNNTQANGGNGDWEEWMDLKSYPVPWTTDPVRPGNETIIVFYYMRARFDLTFNMGVTKKSEKIGNETNYTGAVHMDMYTVYQDGGIGGTLDEGASAGNNKASGTTESGLSWVYTPATGGYHTYVIKNVKFEQEISDAYPLYSWMTVSSTDLNGVKGWYTADGNGGVYSQTSRVRNAVKNYIKSGTTGRNTAGCSFYSILNAEATDGLIYLLECFPGEEADLTLDGVSYKVATEYCQVVNTLKNIGWNAKEIVGCNNTGKFIISKTSASDVQGNFSYKIGDTTATELFTKYKQYYGGESMNLDSWDRAFIFYYARKNVDIEFNLMYDANGDGTNDLVDYPLSGSRIMYGQSIAEYKYGCPDNQTHPLLTREGYVFKGWADENNQLYSDEDWLVMTATADDNQKMIFFAQWEPVTENVIEYYSSLTATEPFEYHYFTDNSLVPMPSLHPDKWVWTNSDVGFRQEFDWNVPMYGAYGSWENSEKYGGWVWIVRVYAVWNDPDLWVKYDANVPEGGIQANAPVDNDTYTLSVSDVPVKLLENQTNTQGKVFVGWLLEENGKIYQAGDHVRADYMPGMTFLAQWVKEDQVVHLKYDPNGGTPGSLYPSESGFAYAVGATAVIWDNTGSGSEPYFTKTASRFLGWNTKADGTGDWYYGDETLTMPDHDVTLYAQWESSSFSLHLYKFTAKTEYGQATELSLSGAVFRLEYEQDGSWYAMPDVSSGEDGWLTVNDLSVGRNYRLTEQTPPAGYEKLSGSWTFHISTTGELVTDDCDWITEDYSASYDADVTALTLRVENHTGVVLPDTGGIGTGWFTGLGLALTALGAGGLLRRKRQDKQA